MCEYFVRKWHESGKGRPNGWVDGWLLLLNNFVWVNRRLDYQILKYNF